jgi:hypothetical protein
MTWFFRRLEAYHKVIFQELQPGKAAAGKAPVKIGI